MRRWRLLVALVGLTVVGVLAAVLMPLCVRTPRITEVQVKMIQVGMTLDEVEAVLGCSPGNYTPRKDFLPLDMSAYGKEQQNNRAPYKEWAADTPDPRYEDDNGPDRQEAIAVRVWFDEQCRVVDKCRMGYSYTAPSIIGRIRTLIGRIRIWLWP
jgi:hypothetical protein